MSGFDDPKYGRLRAHQRDALRLVRQIATGLRGSKTITANVTPGGGKTLMASIVAHEMIGEGLVDHVLIVVPRDSLRSQVRDGFTDPTRSLRRVILADANAPLTQGSAFGSVAGYVTTYQAIAARPKLWQKRLGRGRWLLVLDEPHHLATVADPATGDDPAWSAAIRPLFELATYALLMSGTMRRHDKQPIPFVEYDENRKPIADVVYRRSHALEEQAILPITFTLMDGSVAWERRGATHATSLSEAKLKQLGDAVRTALGEEGYRDRWLVDALGDWMGYRSTVYKSRAIVICHSQAVARVAAQIIREAFAVDVTLAISDEPRAQKALKAFRDRRDGDVLVTVGMAYEGLDVPDCTHLVCLTNVMSEPWLEQAFARVTRFNPHCGRTWEQQHAAIYVLNHPKMRAFVSDMNAEQDEAFREHGDGGTRHPHGRSSYRALDGEQGAGTVGIAGRVFDAIENAAVDRVRRELPQFAHHDALTLLDAAKRLGWVAGADDAGAAED